MSAHIQTLLAILLASAALGGLMWKRLDPVVTIVRYLHGDDGDPKRGVAARPGVLERQTTTELLVHEQAAQIAALTALVNEVVAAVRNNGGSSLKDKVELTLAAVTNGNQAQAEYVARQEVRA